MAAITASMVKDLRERTGLGIMDCKRALADADGDAALAIEKLRKSSGLKAAKKAGRLAADGLVGSKVGSGRGVIVEVNCETDFAARDHHFIAFVERVVTRLFHAGDGKLDGLLESEREALVQKIGENVSLRRVKVCEAKAVFDYIHTNGKIGVLLAMEGGEERLGRELAMHIAAMNPHLVSPDDAPADLVAKEREIYTAQAAGSGKPPHIIKKMVEGRIRKYLAEISLTEQPFVKDVDVKVGALLKEKQASVSGFFRFEVGEGIEKKEVDFATEVQQQLVN